MSLTAVTQLKKFPGIPVFTRETPRVPPQLNKSPGSPCSSREKGPFPCYIQEAIPSSPLHLRGGGVHLMLERNSRGRPTISKDPRCPSVLQTHLTQLTDATVTPRTNSKHDGKCDSPVAPREKATNPHGQPDRMPDTAFLAREESGLAWLHKRPGPD